MREDDEWITRALEPLNYVAVAGALFYLGNTCEPNHGDWLRTVEIKEQDSQRMVIGPTIGDRVGSIFHLAFQIVLVVFIQLLPLPLRIIFSGIAVYWVFYILRALIGTRIIIDKSIQTVVVKKRSLFLTSTELNIPLSGVKSVHMDSKGISLQVGYDRINIFKSHLDEDIESLVEKISEFTGKELIKPEPIISFKGLKHKVKGISGKTDDKEPEI